MTLISLPGVIEIGRKNDDKLNVYSYSASPVAFTLTTINTFSLSIVGPNNWYNLVFVHKVNPSIQWKIYNGFSKQGITSLNDMYHSY